MILFQVSDMQNGDAAVATKEEVRLSTSHSLQFSHS